MRLFLFFYCFIVVLSCKQSNEKLNFDSFELVYKHMVDRNYSVLINNSDSVLIKVNQILPYEYRSYVNNSGFYKMKLNDSIIKFINKSIKPQKKANEILVAPDAPAISYKVFKNKKELLIDELNAFALLNYFEKQIDSIKLKETNWRHRFHNPYLILPVKETSKN